MEIIYMHHAERVKNNFEWGSVKKTFDDITDVGKQEAEILSSRLKDLNVTAIVTSPYLRCKHTAEIINKYHDVEIIEDERFNEIEKNEEWEHLLKRNMSAINDIVNKYNNEDTIICVTSGVNLSAFICYFYNLVPSNDISWCQALDISPVSFSITKDKE